MNKYYQIILWITLIFVTVTTIFDFIDEKTATFLLIVNMFGLQLNMVKENDS